jgi:hypothetical protein
MKANVQTSPKLPHWQALQLAYDEQNAAEIERLEYATGAHDPRTYEGSVFDDSSAVDAAGTYIG